jgi:hypothetical protein
MKTQYRLLYRVASLMALTVGPSLFGTTLYLENFLRGDGTTSLSVGIPTINWEAYTGSSATDSTNASTLVYSTANYGASDAVAVNSQQSGVVYPAQSAHGFLGGSSASLSFGTALIVTDEYSIDTSAYTVDSFTWAMGNNNTSIGVRVAVQIDGNWYASNQLFTNTTAVVSYTSFPTQAETMTFTFTTDANAWRSLSLEVGTSLTISGTTLASDLPSGTITAFGWYVEGMTGNSALRLDDYTITGTAIPEPAESASLAAMTVLLIAMLRRRFHA